MPRRPDRPLATCVLGFGLASLIHFVHNAEHLQEYPNLPESWTRLGVYLAWVGMTVVGVGGWLAYRQGQEIVGLWVLGGYALLGVGSVGHYVVAEVTAHTWGMNATILAEVTTALLVLAAVMRRLMRGASRGATTG